MRIPSLRVLAHAGRAAFVRFSKDFSSKRRPATAEIGQKMALSVNFRIAASLDSDISLPYRRYLSPTTILTAGIAQELPRSVRSRSRGREKSDQSAICLDRSDFQKFRIAMRN